MATADPDATRTICVLDALDECAEPSRLPLINKLADFYSNLNIDIPLKFLITSRPNTAIQNEISRRRSLDLESIQLTGENETEINAIITEINLVIRARVEEFRLLRSQRKIRDNAHLAIQKQLDQIDNRTYLWVALIFPELENNAGLAEKKLLKIIKIIPSTVDEADEKILAQSSDPTQAKKLLHIVVAAIRPLTIIEINVALSIQDGNKSLDDCDLEPDASFRDTVRKLCGLFVRIQDSKVYLIHQTAKVFLLYKESANQTINNVDSGLTFWKHSLNPGDSNLVLAKTCISYLLFDVFEEEIARYTHEHGFLDYAANHWSTHFREAQRKDDELVVKSILRPCNTQSNGFHTWFRFYWRPGYGYDNPREFTDLILGLYLGHESLVKLLLERKDVDADHKDEAGRTPLGWAVCWERGDSEISAEAQRRLSRFQR